MLNLRYLLMSSTSAGIAALAGYNYGRRKNDEGKSSRFKIYHFELY
jgi:hypothetical protein